MADQDEDIEENIFFLTLKQKFSKLYNQAQDSRCLICVPASNLLSKSTITSQLISAHIYKPSPYFQGQFVSFTGKERAITFEGNDIKCLSGFTHTDGAKVLFEELFYNKRYESFRVVCINNILDTKVQFVQKSNDFDLQEVSQMSKDEIRTFLISRASPDQLQILNGEISAFISGYIIVSGYMDDVQEKLADMSQEMLGMIVATQESEPALLRPSLMTALETYILDRVYDKIFPFILESSEKDNQHWNAVVNKLRDQIRLEDVGVQKDFICNQDRAVATLQGLSSMRTPFEMHNCFKATMETIANVVKAHLMKMKKADIAIATDDLLPLLAFVLIKTGIQDFPGYLAYMERFGVAAGSVTEEGFNLVSTRAAVTFVLSELGKDIKPTAAPAQTKRPTKQAPLPRRGSDNLRSPERPGLRKVALDKSPRSAGSTPTASPKQSPTPPRRRVEVLPKDAGAKGATVTTEDMGGFLSRLARGY